MVTGIGFLICLIGAALLSLGGFAIGASSPRMNSERAATTARGGAFFVLLSLVIFAAGVTLIYAGR